MEILDIGNNRVFIYNKERKLHKAVVRSIVKQSNLGVRDNGRFSMCMAGGNTPKPIYKRLSKKDTADKLPWSKMMFFWGDERFVPHSDPASNYRMVRKTLLKNVPIDKKSVYPINTDASPKQSASDYEEVLSRAFTTRPPEFDFTLLGLGDDGHTASIFPGTQIIHESTAWVREVYHVSSNKFRISLTAQVLNASKFIAFIVAGENKAKALYEVLRGEENETEYPAQLIARSGQRIHWFVDAAAGKEVVKG